MSVSGKGLSNISRNILKRPKMDDNERPASLKMARLQGGAMECEKLMRRSGIIGADRLRGRISHDIGQGNARACMFFVLISELFSKTALTRPVRADKIRNVISEGLRRRHSQ
jgi:hypothetical protein